MSHPDRLGKYPITGVLGKGAMGVVYKGFDPVINRPVAIKTIHKALIGQDLSGSSTTARFKNEARAVGRMSHPGIVAIYEYGEDAETAYIAMEYVEGRTLSQILHGTPRPPECDILTLMDQLLAALECAHRHGVWHRDIKPANLLITNTGQLKVTDFGIARIESVVLTQITSTIGTPGYMAPEQYIGDNVDHRIDIFAAGAILYGMLVGHPPFQGSAESVMYKVVNDHPVPPSKVPEAGRPEFYDAIVARALAKKPEQRYQSVSEFRAALAQRDLSAEPDTGETTVIVVHDHTPPAPAIGVLEPPSGVPRSSGTPLPGWDPVTLHQVELALASFVGPMARVLVRKAAREHGDVQGLKTSLCEHLASDHDRQRFLAKFASATSPGAASGGSRITGSTGSKITGLGSGGSRLTGATRGQVPGTQPPGSTGTGLGTALTPEAVAHATRVLSSHMGPIASIVVKKAAAKAQTTEQLHALVAEQVSQGAERDKLLAALRKPH
ncbi:MAG: serine/threonine protein kinase [Rhizobacter sp.]|nr:serine/threonine protein kinase [Rhizobacter sp.]